MLKMHREGIAVYLRAFSNKLGFFWLIQAYPSVPTDSSFQPLAFLLLANRLSEFRMYALQFARRFSYALVWGTIVAAVLLAVTS